MVCCAIQAGPLAGQRLAQALALIDKELAGLVQRVEHRRGELDLAVKHFFGEPGAQHVAATAGHGL
ncbi:hypothetical protein D3C76_1866170 [compost metagenome]